MMLNYAGEWVKAYSITMYYHNFGDSLHESTSLTTYFGVPRFPIFVDPSPR
jgi:hypothetical protein